MTEHNIPIKSDKTASRIIDGEAVIVLLNRQETIVLNEVASRLWELMDGASSIAQLSGIIASEFDTSYEQALSDTTALIEDLLRRGAVRPGLESGS